jgi:general secretion pathway protein G
MRKAFTFVELVIVVLILGILTAVAAPRLLNAAAPAADNSARAQLAMIRAAIDLFQRDAQHLPGSDGIEATFKADLTPYLHKFPALPVDAARNDRVAMDNKTSPIKGDTHPTKGWRYYYTTGVFIINSHSPLASDSSLKYDEL